jgi:hypothetical protein
MAAATTAAGPCWPGALKLAAADNVPEPVEVHGMSCLAKELLLLRPMRCIMLRGLPV